MKTSINRELTTLAQAGQIRADLREFKNRYTENDLLYRFIDSTGISAPYGAEVLRCEVEAFPSGLDFDNKTAFAVEMITFSWTGVCVLRFYCDIDLTIDTRKAYLSDDYLYSCEVFKPQK